jgi:hypothetical protein
MKKNVLETFPGFIGNFHVARLNNKSIAIFGMIVIFFVIRVATVY